MPSSLGWPKKNSVELVGTDDGLVTKEDVRGLAWKAFAEPEKRAIMATMATTKIMLNILLIVVRVVGSRIFCHGAAVVDGEEAKS